jgi:Matrixin
MAMWLLSAMTPPTRRTSSKAGVHGPAVAAAENPSSPRHFAFLARDAAGRPARWNPCAIHPVIVNTAGAPPGALADLIAAIGRLDSLSGLRFRIVGMTTLRPSSGWGDNHLAPYLGWAPVLIAWTGPLGQRLPDEYAGMTTPTWVSNGVHEVFVTAEVLFNADDNTLYTTGPKRRDLFEHELGHLAGLDHTNDPSQIMYPYAGGPTNAAEYGSGDRNGLRELGAGGCLVVPTASWQP